MTSSDLEFDEIGAWTAVKLDIVRAYATQYSKILAAQESVRHHAYVDAFAGAGQHVDRLTKDWIPGSPLNALNVEPPFSSLHLIDLDGSRIENLRLLVGSRSDVHLYQGDANQVLLEQVFPQLLWKDRRRALCLIDPYGMQCQWKVLETAGRMRSIDVFLHFPVGAINRNVLWTQPRDTSDPMSARMIARMNAVWGDDSWRSLAYEEEQTLFGPQDRKRRGNEAIAKGFQKRLREVAGFAYVPKPIPMRNSTGAELYYLFFASPNKTGNRIADHILRKYERMGS
jgi:three-Cys-motif partner protein